MDDPQYESIKSLYALPEGVYVSDVEKDGPAEKAGIKKSDVITKINDTDISVLSDLRKIINTKNPSDTIKITIYRPLTEETLNYDVVLEERQP